MKKSLNIVKTKKELAEEIRKFESGRANKKQFIVESFNKRFLVEVSRDKEKFYATFSTQSTEAKTLNKLIKNVTNWFILF